MGLRYGHVIRPEHLGSSDGLRACQGNEESKLFVSIETGKDPLVVQIREHRPSETHRALSG